MKYAATVIGVKIPTVSASNIPSGFKRVDNGLYAISTSQYIRDNVAIIIPALNIGFLVLTITLWYLSMIAALHNSVGAIEYASASPGRELRVIKEIIVNIEIALSFSIIEAVKVSKVAAKQSSHLDRRSGITFTRYVILRAFNGILTFSSDRISITIMINDIMGNVNPMSSLPSRYFFILIIS